MARTYSDEKAGYYPLDPQYLQHLRPLFAPSQGKILDPCAGEGHALAYLAEAWGLTPYANELNHQRYAECVQRFGGLQAVQGDLRELKATQNAFSVVYCNPPYSLDSTADKPNKRTEFQLLKASWKWVQPNGFMVWVVYDYHLYNNPHALEFLAYHSSQTAVYLLGPHLNHYQQIVVVAQKRAIPYDTDRTAEMATLEAQARQPMDIQELSSAECYTLPSPPDTSRFMFAPAKPNPTFTLQAVQEAGVHQSIRFQELLNPPPPPTLEAPITLPKAAQILMLIVSGFSDGIVLPLQDGRTVMVRGTIQRVKQISQQEEVVEPQTGNVVGHKTTLVTRPKSRVTLLDTEGRVEVLQEEKDIVAFVEEHREALFAYVKAHHKPLYEFDYAGVGAFLSGVHLPHKDDATGKTQWKPLYTTQKHMIAAAYTALQQRQRVIVAGEPGIGKTVVGATLAALVGQQRQAGQVVIFMCPPQLCEKWQREIERAQGLPPRYVSILKRVDEVRDFMNRATTHPSVLHFGIMSKEMAKLGSGWQHALHWRKVHQALWPPHTPPPPALQDEPRLVTAHIPCCPVCGAIVQKGRQPLGPSYFGYDPLTQTYDRQAGSKTQHTCEKCNSRLYQVMRLKGNLPKTGAKLVTENTRMPLATFIARVYPKRVALAVIDEIHECKALASDQGQAMTHLVNTATYSVGLTGTLYGGSASSLYLLLFMFSRHIRDQYPFGGGGLTRFIEQMGVLEQVVEDRPQYENGVYSGTRRYENAAKESPGCSPRLVVETLPCAVFAGLPDVGIQMPRLIETPLEIALEPELEAAYTLGEKHLKEYLIDLRFSGKQWTFMGAYLQALLNYPDACHDPYPVTHQEAGRKVWTFPGLGTEGIRAKEQALIDLVAGELAEGRRVVVFVRQTGTRDIQRRLASLLRDHVPHANPYIMYGGSSGGGEYADQVASANVSTAKREKALGKILEQGHNILLCNPLLVQTGLDLLEFPTLIFYEPLFSLYPMDQASRRHWRIIQQRECRTYYLYYAGTMEARALELLAKKREAAQILYGEMSASGLAALSGDNGIANDLVKALEHLIHTEVATPEAAPAAVDLAELFTRTALANYHSPWTLAVQAEGVQSTSPVLAETPAPLPLLALAENCPPPNPTPPRVLQLLPPRPKTGKRKLDLSHAPEALPLLVPLDLAPLPSEAEAPANPIPLKGTIPPPLPSRKSAEAVQLALF